jgi:PAS domain S-box-containing protein
MPASLNFQDLFRTLPSPHIIFAPDDPDFTILEENEAHAATVNGLPEDVIGKPVMKAFPDTSESYVQNGKSELLESFRRVLKNKKPDTLPVTRYDIANEKGGYDVRYWKLVHYPLLDSKKNVVAIVQKTEEITEEITANARLKRLRSQLDEALSIGKISTWVWDIKQNLMVADANLAIMFGLDPHKAAAGLALEEFTKSIHPQDIERVENEIANAIKQKSHYEVEYRTLNAEGARHWVLARGHVELDQNGEPDTFPGVLIDITERKNAEFNMEFLSKASATLASTLDYRKMLQKIADLSIPHIADWCTVQMLDEQGDLQNLAIAHKDPQKVSWAKELNEEQGPPDKNAPTGVAQVIRTGKSEFYPVITDEMLVATAKNSKHLELLRSLEFYSAMIVPLKNGGEVVGGLTMISTELKRRYTEEDLSIAEELAYRASLAITNANLFRDAQHEIEERMRLEEELRNMNDWLERRVKERTKELEKTNVILERSNRELEDFAYVASHDLQEPLRKIQAFSNLLEEEYASKLGDGADYLGRMRNAAARMSTLIDDLLAFSRVTTKGRVFSKTNLEEIAYEVLNDLETRITKSDGKVTVEKLPTIDADPMQMRQLFQNIISNALKFHRPEVPPIVNISATTKDTKVLIKISDNGVGFDEKYLDRIFSVFQRLHGKESYEGTGIGLAVCRKITERHNGTITAKSTIGRGSTFIITLPKEQKENEA